MNDIEKGGSNFASLVNVGAPSPHLKTCLLRESGGIFRETITQITCDMTQLLLILSPFLLLFFHQLKGVYALKRPQENPRWPPKGKVA